MTSRENLLVTAMEECGELTQAISKGLRFGIDENNNNHICEEFIQLATVMGMLTRDGVLTDLEDEVVNDISVNEEKKIRHYQKESESIGTICDQINLKL